MNYRRLTLLVIVFTCRIVWSGSIRGAEIASPDAAPLVVDHRYAPIWWQTLICLPDDPQKTLVGKEGTLLYDSRGI
ncbi:MAG: hypothetical protein ACLQNE_44390 [Thermoguttaceae bacterium]